MTDAKKDAIIQNNLDEKLKTTGGTGRRVMGKLSCFVQSKEDHFGFFEVSTGVDATLAVNSVNTSSSQGYFQTVVNSMLSPLDCVSTDGTVCKCISIVQYGRHNVEIAQPSTM